MVPRLYRFHLWIASRVCLRQHHLEAKVSIASWEFSELIRWIYSHNAVICFRQVVELKKVNSKYILKSTLTPRPARKDLGQSQSTLTKSHSCSSLDEAPGVPNLNRPAYNNYLTVHVSTTFIHIIWVYFQNKILFIFKAQLWRAQKSKQTFVHTCNICFPRFCFLFLLKSAFTFVQIDK